MGYMQDAPRSVSKMIAVLRDMGQYRYDAADVFRDAVDYATAALLVQGDPELAERLMKKYGADYVQLGNFMRAWVLTLNEEIEEEMDWFDALGTVYEYLASNSKRSWLGQFFTPPDLCDLMTAITMDKGTTGKRLNDPACGSGRMLLSFNKLNPGNRLFGEDLDPICARMTALNMAVHGCQGQVVCMDSLALNDWRFGYEVNPYHRTGGPPVPHLLPLRREDSVAWQRNQEFLQNGKERAPRPAPVEVPREPVATVAKPVQLTLF